MHCDDQALQSLLSCDAHVEERVARHLEDCRQCQSRLESLAADADSWVSVSDALREGDTRTSVIVSLDSELTADLAVQADQVPLDFLKRPTHPEMLGRLGRYEVERCVGAGGMGIVLKAFDTELHRPVAIKVLAPHLAHSGAARQRFAREAQSAAAVMHENVVPIHNVDVEEKLPFLVMQFVAGESLQARVDRDGCLGTREVLRIGAQIARGLAAAHEQGLVHRDVKPANVLLEERVDRVLISDFGLARAADDASMTRSGVIAGTPHYMSPEQARGEPVDPRSDLFGLGCVLYFMCTGRSPFRAEGAMAVLHRICSERHRTVRAVNERVPRALSQLIDRLLEKKPSRRPASAADVADQLTRLMHQDRVPRRIPPVSTKVWGALACVVCAAAALWVGPQLWQRSGDLAEGVDTPSAGSVAAPSFGGDQGHTAPQAFVSPTHEAEASTLAPAQDRAAGDSGLVHEPPSSVVAAELDWLQDAEFDQQVSALMAELEQRRAEDAAVHAAEPPLIEHGWSDEVGVLQEWLKTFEAGSDAVEWSEPKAIGSNP